MTSTNALAMYEEALRKELETINTRLGTGTRTRISTQGGVFTLPDGTTNPGPLAAVILDWTNSHAYWETVFGKGKAASPPVCYVVSKDLTNMRPNPNSPKPQAPSCEECRFNEFNTAPVGGGKACKQARRLLIIAADAKETDTPLTLDTSPGGIKVFDAYIESLATIHKVHPLMVVTKIEFNPQNNGQLKFSIQAPLDKDKLPLMMKLRDAGAQSLLK